MYHASTIVFPTYEEFKQGAANKLDRRQVLYGRLGTPTTVALEDTVSGIEGGYAAVTTSCGMSAITTALLAYVKAGDHLLITDSVYKPTREFCNKMLASMNIETTYYDPMIGADIDSLIRDNTRLIYLEAPGSITFEVQDVPAITTVARQRNVLTLIDNTWGTPFNFPSFEHGIDISIHAGTKYIVGHSDAMLGLIVTTEAQFEPIREAAILLGQCAGPDDVYLALRGMRTLPVRLKGHAENSLTLARWFSQQPSVKKVLHPAFPDCPGHEFYLRDFRGGCGLFGVVFHPQAEENFMAFVEALSLFGIGASWGGYESLVLPADPTEFRTAVPWTEPGRLIRFHAGLEHIEDLLMDLEQGIQHLNS